MSLAESIVWYLGIIAGVGAISLSLYIQAIYRFRVPASYTIGLYLFGVVVIIFHLEPVWISSGLNSALELLAWSIVLAFEVAVFYDVHTRFSRFQSIIAELHRRMQNREQ